MTPPPELGLIIGLYVAPTHRAVSLDAGAGNFARPFETQADSATQILEVSETPGRAAEASGETPGRAAEESDPDGIRDHSLGEGEDGADEAAEVEGRRLAIIHFEDLLDEGDFWAVGFGHDGALIMKADGEDLIVEDRRLMQRLFKTGKDQLTVKFVGDMKHNPPGTSGNDSRKNIPNAYGRVRKLFKAFANQFPRLATLQGENLHLRVFPDDEDGQTKMHNDCMEAVRLELKTVSQARVKWMSGGAGVKRELEPPAAAEPAGPSRRARRTETICKW